MEALKFNNKKSYALLRIPTFTTKAFKISKLSNKESKIFCDQKNIFYSPNMRVLVLKNQNKEIFSIYKDLSIVKNNSLRNLSMLVYSSALNDAALNAFAFYNAIHFKVSIDFYTNIKLKAIKFTRFSIITNKPEIKNYIGNSELGLFDF